MHIPIIGALLYFNKEHRKEKFHERFYDEACDFPLPSKSFAWVMKKLTFTTGKLVKEMDLYNVVVG